MAYIGAYVCASRVLCLHYSVVYSVLWNYGWISYMCSECRLVRVWHDVGLATSSFFSIVVPEALLQ